MRDTEGKTLGETWTLKASDLDFVSTANKLYNLGLPCNHSGPPLPLHKTGGARLSLRRAVVRVKYSNQCEATWPSSNLAHNGCQ